MSQSSKSKTYTFVYSDKCDMCQAGSEDQAFVGRRLDQRQGLWPKRVPGITGSVFSCRQCGLLYPNPMPIPASIGQHYDVNPEEYWPQSYFDNIPTKTVIKSKHSSAFTDPTCKARRSSMSVPESACG